jgi:predicted dehydrogenase
LRIAARSSRRRQAKGISRSAISAGSTRATGPAKQAIDEGRIGRIVSMASRRNIPAAWTPTILNKIGPIVGDAIHDTDLMLWFTGDRVVSAYAQTVDVRGLKHPDIGQTMYRFAGGATATLETVWCMPEKTPYDIDERMNIVGTEGFIQIQDTFPNLGIADGNKFHSPDITYWPMFEGVRGGALREEFFVFRQLSARRPEAGDRHAQGCDGGAGGDAGGGRIGADRRSGADRLRPGETRNEGEEQWQSNAF